MFQARELRKSFKDGDHVRVVAGRYEGETGLVVRIEHNLAILFSDLTMHEVCHYACMYMCIYCMYVCMCVYVCLCVGKGLTHILYVNCSFIISVCVCVCVYTVCHM